jgi:ABC-2 type transport system permease protein
MTAHFPGGAERYEGTDTMNYAIEARGLVKTYRGDVRALDGVSLVADRFLVSPAGHGLQIAGRLIQRAMVGVIQALIIIALGLVVGATYPGGIAGLTALTVCAVLLGTAIGALSNGVALLSRREETMIAVSNFVLLPLTFLSSVFMAQALMPQWMQDVAQYNPVNWAVQAGREALAANGDWSIVFSRMGYLVVFTAVCTWLATRAFRVYQRSI